MTKQRVSVLGLPVDALTMDETVERLERLMSAEPNTVHQHVVINAAKVVSAQDDELLRTAITSASVINADGMSVVWASRLLGSPLPERVAGIDLMQRLVAWAAANRRSIYLLGATSAVVDEVSLRLVATNPGLKVAGHRNGYWSSEEEEAVVTDIAETGADLLFVALPSPAKELFVNRHRDRLNVSLVMGVGGSFDVVSGLIRRAPRWVQKFGLEWLYRMLQEPRRMFRRYLIGNSAFIFLMFKEMTRRLMASRRR
jgi:N-acetylglucosaminyldiphosphoundecaprenol N-acetyl-beta-D-mannosaminyltransferase